MYAACEKTQSIADKGSNRITSHNWTDSQIYPWSVYGPNCPWLQLPVLKMIWKKRAKKHIPLVSCPAYMSREEKLFPYLLSTLDLSRFLVVLLILLMSVKFGCFFFLFLDFFLWRFTPVAAWISCCNSGSSQLASAVRNERHHSSLTPRSTKYSLKNYDP